MENISEVLNGKYYKSDYKLVADYEIAKKINELIDEVNKLKEK